LFDQQVTKPLLNNRVGEESGQVGVKKFMVQIGSIQVALRATLVEKMTTQLYRSVGMMQLLTVNGSLNLLANLIVCPVRLNGRKVHVAQGDISIPGVIHGMLNCVTLGRVV
jgi:hypothetical protein